MCMERPYSVKCNPCKTKKGGNKERVTGRKRKLKKKKKGKRIRDGKVGAHLGFRVVHIPWGGSHITQYAGSYDVHYGVLRN